MKDEQLGQKKQGLFYNNKVELLAQTTKSATPVFHYPF